MTNGSQKPTICMMCPSLAGGLGRVMFNLANSFKQMDLDVHFAVDNLIGSFTRKLDPEIKVHVLKSTHRLGGIPYFFRYVKHHRPDIILTTIPRHTALAVKVRRLSNVPSKIYPTVHNTYGTAYRELSSLKQRARVHVLRKFYPQCDGIVAVSAGVKEDFSALTGIQADRITVIYNPIYNEELIRQSAEPLHHSWFDPEEPPVILGVGRLYKQKNFKLLIRAFNLLRSQMVCRLVIVGEGEDREMLEAMASQSEYSADISLIGFKENPFPFMKQAALFVLSSLWEGFGNVTVEAMATGTTVVSTDCPSGPREILLNGKYGRLVPVNDPEKLAEAMKDCLENPTPPEILLERAAVFSDHAAARYYLRLFGLLQ